jgi:hypothetical protein
MGFAGVIELTMGGRGPQRGYVFDPHRLALPAWAEATVEAGAPAVLLTLDRHFDTVAPVNLPPLGMSPDQLDEHARRRLDVRNYDHVLAAMEAGVVSHAIIVARARPVGAVDAARWVDSRGGEHQLVSVATVDALSADFGKGSASEPSRRAEALLREATSVLLDVDLDCFTSPSDADPTTVLPWPIEVIRQHVLPAGSEAFWALALGKCVALTFAREPSHCGGLIAGGRLFEVASQVIFRELLETDLP